MIKYRLICVLMVLLCPLVTNASELRLFGTIGTQVESVSPDTADNQNYIALRDIYTRVALQFQHQLQNGLMFEALLELPIDTANRRIQHVWDQRKDVTDTTQRIAKLKITSQDLGSVWIGKGWVPYYNEISAVVDRFNSYYVGYATYSTLREDELIVYSTPVVNGWKVNLARAHGNGDREKNGSFDDRDQITISHVNKQTKFALGIEDIGGANDRRVMGVSLAHTIGALYIGAKYERNQSDIKNKAILGYDNSSAKNLYIEYAIGQQKLKAHIAKVEGFGEDIFHLGYSYQLNEKTILFAEYYREQNGAGISSARGGFRETYWDEGGKALAIGFNYSFDVNLFK